MPSWRLDASGAYIPSEYILAFDAACMLYVLAPIQQFLLHTGPSHCVIRNVNIIDINNAFHTDICLRYFHHNHLRSDLELCASSLTIPAVLYQSYSKNVLPPLPATMVYFLDLLYSQLLVKIPEQTSDFSNQTVIVTGSNTGLGLEAARLLLRLNASKVILAVRTISKGEAAAKSIISSCNVPASKVEVWQLDMSNKDSIIAFAKRAAALDRLDAAILNAGVFNFKRNDIDGIEAHLAVNVIGATLLELLLLPTMQRSAARTGLRGRMTLVGSDMMYTVNPADFQTEGAMFPYINTPAR